MRPSILKCTLSFISLALSLYPVHSQDLLFSKSSSVNEFTDPQDVISLLSSLQTNTEQPVARSTTTCSLRDSGSADSVGYYAVGFFHSWWCPYCKRAAPIFDASSKFYSCTSRIRFFAFECTDRYHVPEKSAAALELCRSQNVEQYPTYNFYWKSESNLEFIQIPKIVKYNLVALGNWLAVHTSIRGACITIAPSNDLLTQVEGAKSAILKAEDQSRWSFAAKTTVDIRLHDSLNVLLYMIWNWVPLHNEGVSPLRAKHLLDFLAIASKTLPGVNVREKLASFHTELRSFVVGNSVFRVNRYMTTEQYHMIAMKHISEFAGLPIKGPDQTSKVLHGSTLTGSIWMLLHYITLGAENGMTPHIKRQDFAFAIRNTIDSFFMCEVCRFNFLESFDSCRFGSCEWVNDASYPLDIWMHRFHNAVTFANAEEQSASRVISKLPAIATTTKINGKDQPAVTYGPLTYFVGSDVRFPSHQMCPTCRVSSGINGSIPNDLVDDEIEIEFRKLGLSRETYLQGRDWSKFDIYGDFSVAREVIPFLRKYYLNAAYTDKIVMWNPSTSAFVVS